VLIRAIIFDMDGVLIDSEPVHLIAYQEILGRFDITYSAEENAQYLGRKDSEIALELIDKYDLPLQPDDLVRHKEESFARLIEQNSLPRPGVVDTLKRARQLGLKTGVASSATLASIKLIVNCLALHDYFHTLTSGDEVACGKPAPDVYLLAARRLSVQPHECLVIEDTEAGVMAAKSAGMTCIAIPCEATLHQEHELADLKLQSLSELDLSDWVGSS